MITHRMTLPSHSTNEAPIHRLVDDILVYIFLLNATLPDDTSRSDLYNSSPRTYSTNSFPQPSTLNITKHTRKRTTDNSMHSKCRKHATVASSQVCMRWRSIALHCCTIWGPIIDYSRHSFKWIETLLNRSRPSPLDFGSRINCVYLDHGAEGVLELVFNHIDRLRVFNLYVPKSSWELVCLRFLQLPAPNLEFVVVKPFSGVPELPDPLFDHHSPNLRNLHLHHCTVDFTSPILTRLTELYVNDIGYGSAVPTVLDWLNILGGMPSLRWLTLVLAISSVTTNATYPIIDLAALEMLSVWGAFHESVTLIEHLIAPPRCGLRLQCDGAHVGVDQRKLCAIIEKKMDSWAKNAPNRHLTAWSTQHSIAIGNRPRLEANGPFGPVFSWGTEAEIVQSKLHVHLSDPVMAISLGISNPQDSVSLFFSLFALFERTFLDTTHLQLAVADEQLDVEPDVFLPLVDSFRSFVNLEEMWLHDSLPNFLFPHLQHSMPNSLAVLLPALQSLRFGNRRFRHTSVLRVADFLRWRRVQGLPVQKINIVISFESIDMDYLLTHSQDTVIEIDIFSDSFEDEEEDDI